MSDHDIAALRAAAEQLRVLHAACVYAMPLGLDAHGLGYVFRAWGVIVLNPRAGALGRPHPAAADRRRGGALARRRPLNRITDGRRRAQ